MRGVIVRKAPDDCSGTAAVVGWETVHTVTGNDVTTYHLQLIQISRPRLTALPLCSPGPGALSSSRKPFLTDTVEDGEDNVN